MEPFIQISFVSFFDACTTFYNLRNSAAGLIAVKSEASQWQCKSFSGMYVNSMVQCMSNRLL